MLSKFACVALAATLVSAQTHSECDPTKRDGCPNPKALGAKVVDHDWTKGPSDFVFPVAGTTLSYDKEQGALYRIGKETDAPTVHSDKYIFFGELHVKLRAAPGKGIVSSIVLQSDDLDEIDWEWLGTDASLVQTNYFSKGCTETYDRGGKHAVSNAFTEYHTYSIIWTRERLDWQIDGVTIRSVHAKDVGSGCSGYPQSPMQVRLGSWVAGRSSASPGTIEWAGGLANWAEGPFDSYYKSIRVVDYMGGGGAKAATEYVYTDRSGKWESIKIVNNGNVESGSSSGTAKPTKTSGSGSSTATTFTTATTGETQATETSGSGSGSGAGTTTGSGQAPTGGAGKVALTFGNVALIGAALFYLAL